MNTNVKRALEALAIVAVIVAMAGFLGNGHFKGTSHFAQSDTTVWYCAGQAVNERADPYLVEPMRACELRYDPAKQSPWVEPAPLPGYTLAAFSLMARLPFALARTIWFYALIGAISITAVLLARRVKIPPLVALLCLAMVDGYFNLFYGELPPIAVAALVASAGLGTARRYTAAAIVGSLAMIEPHIGLPACLAMFVWWPKTRVPFVICGCGLAAVSVAAIGLPANLEYFQTVLPLHAAAEIAAQDQYSLTRLMHILGVPDRIAVSAGSLSYLIMTVAGVALARPLATAVESETLITLLPPAVALLGGPFVHDLQMAAAIPAALLLAASTRPPLAVRAFALVAIVFPWHAWNLADARGQVGLLEIAAVAGAMLVALRTKPVKVQVGAVVATVLASIAIATAIEAIPRHHVGPPTTIAPMKVDSRDMGSADWAAYVSRDVPYSTPDARDVAEKIPVWLALLAVGGMGLAMSRRSARCAVATSAAPPLPPEPARQSVYARLHQNAAARDQAG
jgi:hypothetical protein